MKMGWFKAAVCLAIGVVSACSIEQAAPEAVSESEQAIENGTIVENDTIGNVRVFATFDDGASYACSGTIVTSDWVLTARHCVDRRPVGLSSSSVEWRGESRSVVDVVDHDQLDVSLLHLDAPYAVGTAGAYVNQPWTGTTAALIGQRVDCYGYGPNEFNGPIGTLRTANLAILEAASDGTFYRTEMTHRRLPGDSGSGCFLSVGGTRYQVGVHSQGWTHDVSAEAYRDWVQWHVLPSCTDGHQSTFEEGIDCGGICAACPPIAAVSITSEWQTGYCANVVVTNRQERRLRWQVVFDARQSSVFTIWGGAITNAGSLYTVTGEPWTEFLNPLQSATIGFCANKTGSEWQPRVVDAVLTE